MSLASYFTKQSDYYTAVQQLYVAYFGRPADPQGLFNFSRALHDMRAPTTIGELQEWYNAGNGEVRSLIESFGSSNESRSLYSGDTTEFVISIYQNVLNRKPDADGMKFWIDAINSGTLSRANASASIMAGAQSNNTLQGKLDAQLVGNKIEIARLFTQSLNTDAKISAYKGDGAAANARSMLSDISKTASSNNEILSKVNAAVDVLTGNTGGNSGGSYIPVFTATNTVTTDSIAKTATIDFADAVLNNTADLAALKAALKVSIYSGAFAPLESGDAVAIDGSGNLVITFADFPPVPLFQFEIAAGALRNTAGVTNAAIITEVGGSIEFSSVWGITLTPFGGNVVSDTLNSTNTHLQVSATISGSGAVGGKAEFYLGAEKIGQDSSISPGDQSVRFTISDGTPTNSELQAKISAGGVVTVKLINAAGDEVASASDATLSVDYVAPTLQSVVGTGDYEAGDTLVFTFSEAIGNTEFVEQMFTEDSRYGASATPAGVAWNGDNTVLTVTLGADETLAPETAIVLVGFRDLAGNSGSYGDIN